MTEKELITEMSKRDPDPKVYDLFKAFILSPSQEVFERMRFTLTQP